MRIPGLMTVLVMMLAAVTTAQSTAHAEVVVRVDKAAQRMHVLVDGQVRHKFVVSTGLAGGPPTGTFRPQRLERSWHSRLFNMAPMPYSIFFHGNFAIHGTNAISKLGRRASHGCVRLRPDNAATLFNLVKTHGMANTRIIIEPSTRAADLEPQRKADVRTDRVNSATAEAHVTGPKAE